MRIGIGYDIHRLVPGRKMVIGGVEIPYPKGPEGHSDGDPLLHAVCDAILGAIGTGDIGMMFPDTDPRYKGVSSRELLSQVIEFMETRGYSVVNLDCVVIAEEPKIAPHKGDIVKSIQHLVKAVPGAVNVKGKTSEGLGVIGEGKAVSAYAVILLKTKHA
jgi:2-C-methyl-D-erythritol 2,4-cyclodiphosphate synthase